MKTKAIDFKSIVYEGERKDFIGPGGDHNYKNRVVGIPNEIEYILSLLKQALTWCHRMGYNNNQRWEQVQDIFIFEKRGHKVWTRIRDRDYGYHVNRTNQALRDEMIPKMLDEILGSTDNAEMIYEYLHKRTCNLDVFEIGRWTERVMEIYALADEMNCAGALRPSILQRTRWYTTSVGPDMMDEVESKPGMSDILDDANNNANPKPIEAIALVIANIQRKRNKDKNLILNEEMDKFVKKYNGGGGGASGGRGNGNRNDRGNGGGDKRNWSSNNNNQSNKKQRFNNHQNKQSQRGGNFDDKQCELPGHGGHKWKDCVFNYRNKEYKHEGAVRMAGRDGVPGWFKGQVEKSTARRSGNNGNNNKNSHSYYKGNNNYHSWQQPPAGPPPNFNYHYDQQQPHHHSYMQMPPPPQQAPRGPGRNGPPIGPPSSGPPGGPWVYQQQR